MTSQKGTKPPKEIWVVAHDMDRKLARPSVMMTRPVDPDGERWHRYRLVAPKPEPREAVALVLKRGDCYLYDAQREEWTPERSVAVRWKPEQREELAQTAEAFDGARIVKLVRKRGTP